MVYLPRLKKADKSLTQKCMQNFHLNRCLQNQLAWHYFNQSECSKTGEPGTAVMLNSSSLLWSESGKPRLARD